MLRTELAKQNIKLHIIEVEVGANITRTVFETMVKCEGFIAFAPPSAQPPRLPRPPRSKGSR